MNSLTLGMIHTCIITQRSQDLSLSFSSGSAALVTGKVITGSSSKATGTIKTVTVTSGAWAGGDAAGVLTLSLVTGTFQAGETITTAAPSNGSAIAGAAALISDELGTPQYTETETSTICRFGSTRQGGSVISGSGTSGDFISSSPMVFLPGTAVVSEGDLITSLEPYFSRQYTVEAVEPLFDFHTNEIDHLEATLKAIEKG